VLERSEKQLGEEGRQWSEEKKENVRGEEFE